MLEKEFAPKRTVCKVTFSLPGEWAGSGVQLAGDFNNWKPDTDPLEKKDGRWVITKRLKPETEYRFRYLLDGEKWENDDDADAYIPNQFGSEDSVLITGK